MRDPSASFGVVVALGIAAIGLALSLRSTAVAAEEVLLVSHIDGAQAASTCPQGSAGTGIGKMTYDTDTNLLSWNVTFAGLSAAPTVAHFHGPAGPGVDAGIQVTIADLTSPSVGSATLTAVQETDLLADLWYINYHTAKCGGGEIRGQVLLNLVGGVAELPEAAETPLQAAGSSGSNAGLVAGIAAAAAVGMVVLSGGAWYVRRRSLR